MHLLKMKSATKIFYYLMAVDGDVSSEELNCFDEIGHEIDPDSFAIFREVVITDCEKQLNSTIDEEDHYEVVLEGADRALAEQTDDLFSGVSIRLLVWDMLVIAFSNYHYAECERRLIKHIVRTMGVEHSVFLEMEQLMKTNVSVGKELSWIKTTNRSYAEVAPIVAELENRRAVIMTCAKALIEDELYSAVKKVNIPQNKVLESAKAMIGEATAPVATELCKQTKRMFNEIKSWKKNVENKSLAEKDICAQVCEKPDTE